MSDTATRDELGEAIAAAELTIEEALLVRQLVDDEELEPDEAIQAALATREQERDEEPPPAVVVELGEPSDKTLKALDAETTRHLKRVNELMGGHVAGFAECDKCGGIGLVPPGPSPRAHEWFRSCDTCSGFGQVLTGSLREGQNARDCPRCKGRGYLEAIGSDGQALADKPGPAPVATALPASAPAEGAPAPAPVVQAEPTFGTPSWMGDPAIGH